MPSARPQPRPATRQTPPPLAVELAPAAVPSEPAREQLVAFLRRRIERGRARLKGEPPR